MRPVETPSAPSSMQRASSPRIAPMSSGDAAAAPGPMTNERIEPIPARNARLIDVPASSTASKNSAAERNFSLGNGDEPQLPRTSVVTPSCTLLSAVGRSMIPAPPCECTSMKPGEATAPLASITCSASMSSPVATAAMRSPSMAMSAFVGGAPVPSTTRAFFMSSDVRLVSSGDLCLVGC